MSEIENSCLEVKIPAVLADNLRAAADCQGITVEEAAAAAVESYLKMFDEVIGDSALEDSAVQAMIRSIFPDEGTERRGIVLKLPGVASDTET